MWQRGAAVNPVSWSATNAGRATGTVHCDRASRADAS